MKKNYFTKTHGSIFCILTALVLTFLSLSCGEMIVGDKEDIMDELKHAISTEITFYDEDPRLNSNVKSISILYKIESTFKINLDYPKELKSGYFPSGWNCINMETLSTEIPMNVKVRNGRIQTVYVTHRDLGFYVERWIKEGETIAASDFLAYLQTHTGEVSAKVEVSDFDIGMVAAALRDVNVEVTGVNLEFTDGLSTIGSWAFQDCNLLTSVTIPASVNTIDYGAFQHCTQLKSVTISNGVNIIHGEAFGGCESLKSVTIPASVTSIEEGPFGGCRSLLAINVDSGNANYVSENGIVFNKDKTEIVCYPAGKTASSYSIPSSVTTIGGNAFSSCGSLKSVAIPSSVTRISWSAFNGCWSLKSITIPNSVTSIGGWAFGGCDSLTSITIPASVTSIEGNPFCNCRSLTSINVDSGNANYISDDGIVFNKDKTAIVCYPAGKTGSSYTISSSVTEIKDGAFNWCSSLKSITIPNSVTTIGSNVFDGTSIESITIPGSVTNMGYGSFQGCGNLKEIKFISATPPANGLYLLGGAPSTCVIKVPASAVPSYQAALSDVNFYGRVEGY